MSYRGAIDTPQGARLAGWATDAAGQPCSIRIYVAGQQVAMILSDLRRPDLVTHGLSQGLGGFVIDVSPHLTPGANDIALLFPDGTHMPGSATRRYAREDGSVLVYRGAIDAKDDERVSGWAVTDQGDPCTLVIEVNEVEVAREDSRHPRPDLLAAGVSKGDGGFNVKIGAFLKGGENKIGLRFPNGVHLPGSPFTRMIARAGAAPAPEPVPTPEPAPGPEPAQAVMDSPEPAIEPPLIEEARVSGKAEMPSLIELDEISLDDISFAIASGIVSLPPPEIPPLVRDLPSDGGDQAVVERPPAPRPGLFGRLLRRARR